MRAEKQSIIDEFKQRIEDSDFAILLGYKGLTVEQVTDLRGRLREREARFHVVRNSFLRRAVEGQGFVKNGELDGILDGPTAMVTGKGDVCQIAKALAVFGKELDVTEIRGGFLEGQVLSSSDVNAMAKLPSREVLLAQLVGTIAAPLSGLVGVLKQKTASIVYVLKAIEDKK